MKPRQLSPLPGLTVRESEVFLDLRRLYPDAPKSVIQRQAIAVAHREEKAERVRRSLWNRIKKALGW
jgi:hypothetical protein